MTRFETWLNGHKRKMELYRTLLGLLAVTLQLVILGLLLTGGTP